MDPDPAERAGLDAFIALGALALIEHDPATPGQGVFRTGLDAELLLAGYADVNSADLGPVVLDVDPGSLGALQAGFMGCRAGQHA
jgi:hypothetical protein